MFQPASARSSLFPRVGSTLLLLLAGLPSAALAATDATAALEQVLVAAPSRPVLAAACAPAGTALSGLATLIKTLPNNDLGSQEQDLLASFATVDGQAALGLDTDGVVSLTLWQALTDPVGVMTFAYSGDEDTAVALLQRLADNATVLSQAPGQWQVLSESGQPLYVASLVDQQLSLTFNGHPPDAAQAEPAVDMAVVRGLPTTPGCVAWVAPPIDLLPKKLRAKLPDDLALGAFLAFEKGQPARFRLRPGPALPNSLAGAGAAPVTGSSVDVPAVVISLGVGIGQLLSDPTIQARMDLSPRQAKRVARWLNVAPGSTVAAFGDPRAMDLVAVLPLDGAAGPTTQARVIKRLRRLAKKVAVTVLSTDDQGLFIDVKGTPTRVEVRDGRVTVGPSEIHVQQAADGQGQPWVSADAAAWAMQWPVSAWTAGEGTRVGPAEFSLKLGARTQDDIIDVGVQVQTTADRGLLGMMAASILNRVGAGALASSSRASGAQAVAADDFSPLEQVERTMDGIALAQEVQRSANGAYVALPPAPRPVGQLGPTAVDWKAEGAWATLGWSPESPQQVLATYWVELADDGAGYAVHAELDLDGDGQRAHFVRTSDAPMVRTTPPGVE